MGGSWLGFGQTITNTALFLYEAGLDIRLVRYRLYKTDGGELVLSVAQLLPVPDAEDFMVRPRSSSTTQANSQLAGRRRASAVERLVAHRRLPDGTSLSIVVPDLVDQDREAISVWLAEDETRSRVTWHNDVQTPVEWAVDGQRYPLVALIKKIIFTATGAPPRAQIWAQNWFRDSSNQTLHRIAEPLP